MFEGIRGGNTALETEGEIALDDLNILTYCEGADIPVPTQPVPDDCTPC